MLRQVAALQAQPLHPDGQFDLAAMGNLPAGTIRYSFVSTSSANGTCSRSVQVTSLGAGQPPKVVSNASGNCGDDRAGTTLAAQPQALPEAPSVHSSAPPERDSTI